MKKTHESGRNMVEMLGVLAIIGVLSVAGIAGYTTTMNKHRANQILNGASVRAIVASTQIQRGSAAPTLGEFTDNEVGGAKFGTEVKNEAGTADWTTTNKRFSLTLENVAMDVCNQMKVSVGQNSIIREINEGCTTITYNNDLSPNDPAPSGPKGDECTDICSDEAKCENGYCQCSEGLWQPSDNSGNGECKEITEGDCATNANCKEGEYCVIRSTKGNCEKPDNGTCETLKSGIEKNYNGTPFLLSSDGMNWWSARNWCLAHGKSLASLSDLGITGGYENSCSESDCTGADWDALKAAFGSSYYWTNDSYNSCFAFLVNTNFQNVNTLLRANYLGYALCR